MRILFLTDNFPPETNAAATRVYERACYWTRWGHDVTILTSAPNFPQGEVYPGFRNRWFQRERLDGMEIVRVKTFVAPNKGVKLRILDFLSYMVSATIASVFLKRPDIVVATSPQFFCAVAGSNVAFLKRVPFVFELADLWPASIRAVGAIRSGPLLKRVERMELALYRRSRAVVALTEAFKADLVGRGIPANKVAVVRNGVDIERHDVVPRCEELAKSLGLDGKFVVGYIGTHGMAHELQNVLESAALLGDRREIRFLLVGGGAAREALIEQRDDAGLENVVFVPPVPKEKVDRYWGLCDLALVHLKDDPVFETVIPSKMFEAMAYAKPIVLAAPHGEAAELLENSGAGVWVPPAQPQALADLVASLASDPERRRAIGQTGRQAAPRFSRENQAKYMLDVLERVIEGKDAQVIAPARALP